MYRNLSNSLSLKFCYHIKWFDTFICFIYYFSKIRPVQKILNKTVKEFNDLIEMHFFKAVRDWKLTR